MAEEARHKLEGNLNLGIVSKPVADGVAFKESTAKDESKGRNIEKNLNVSTKRERVLVTRSLQKTWKSSSRVQRIGCCSQWTKSTAICPSMQS